MGKGSGRRPMEITQAEWDANYERMFGKKPRRVYVPPPLADEDVIPKGNSEAENGSDMTE
jgi:hypothetical protein